MEDDINKLIKKNEDDLKKNEDDLKKNQKINLNWLWHNSKLT
jgi:hypothetical protein